MNTIIRYMSLGLLIFSLAFFSALHYWLLVGVAGITTTYCVYLAALDSWVADVYKELFYEQLEMNEGLITEMLDTLPK